MLHEDAILLNCGRNALAYLLETKGIKKLYLPYFLCDSVANVCKKYGVEVAFYHIGENWLPKDLVIDGDACALSIIIFLYAAASLAKSSLVICP